MSVPLNNLRESGEPITLETRLELDECIEISDPLLLPEQPLLSVLMLAYNHGSYLAQAIEGVLMQETDFPIELLIGEDCSDDNTREIALDYQHRYPHLIRMITSVRNVGMRANFKRLLEKSRGELLAVCEGDDYWIDKRKIFEQVAALRKYPQVDLAFHSCYVKWPDSDTLAGPYIAKTRDTRFSPSEVISGGGGFMPTASIVVRRSAVNRIPEDILDAAPACDYPIQAYGALGGGAFYIDKPMCVYRRGHPESWTTSLVMIENIIKAETQFNKTLLAMDADTKDNFRDDFNRLIFTHYFTRLLRSHYERDIKRIALYSQLLISNSGRFGFGKRMLIRVCDKRALMLPIFIGRRLIEKLIEKLSLSSKKYLRDL